ncbi:MAG: hypothetical protein JNK04_07400 [Myxococcales bacterium]|nr:hypothetical protein [Myxococcales bacterium]
MTKRTTRRRLFADIAAAMRDEQAGPRQAPSFSLQAFYAARDPAPRELPVVVLRAGLRRVPTTAVGLCSPIEGHDEGELT